MHPECPPQALRHADFIGSTSAIIQFAERTEGDVIIGTEKSISDWLSFQHPDRRFPVASKHLLCPDMRLTTLAEVRRALLGTGGDEIVIDETLRRRALRPIEEMIRLGQAYAEGRSGGKLPLRVLYVDTTFWNMFTLE